MELLAATFKISSASLIYLYQQQDALKVLSAYFAVT